MAPNGLSRRQFLVRSGLGGAGLLLSPSLLAACSSDEDTATGSTGSSTAPVEATDVKFRLNWVPAVDFNGWYVADSQGLYEEAGISLDIIPGGPNTPEPVQVLAGGATDIAIVTDLLTLSDANKEGGDFVVWGAKSQQSPLGMLSLADNPILTAEDMVGKTLGGPEGDQIFIDAVLSLNGLTPGDYEFVPTGFNPSPLTDGKVEGLTVYVTNQPISLDLKGIENVPVTFAEMGMPSYADMLASSRSYLEDNHDLIVNFLKATISGWEYANADDAQIEEATNLMLNDYGGLDAGQELEQQVLAAKAQIPLMESPVGYFWIDMEEVAGPIYDALRATGREDLPDPETLFDLSILQEIYPDATA